jgi:hypothetical protein
MTFVSQTPRRLSVSRSLSPADVGSHLSALRPDTGELLYVGQTGRSLELGVKERPAVCSANVSLQASRPVDADSCAIRVNERDVDPESHRVGDVRQLAKREIATARFDGGDVSVRSATSACVSPSAWRLSLSSRPTTFAWISDTAVRGMGLRLRWSSGSWRQRGRPRRPR